MKKFKLVINASNKIQKLISTKVAYKLLSLSATEVAQQLKNIFAVPIEKISAAFNEITFLVFGESAKIFLYDTLAVSDKRKNFLTKASPIFTRSQKKRYI